MKKIKIETKTVIKYFSYAITCIVVTAGMVNIISNIYYFIKDPVAVIAKYDLVNIPKKQRFYSYNEKVPESVIENEIREQAKQFGLDPDIMVELAKCESGLDNLAKNDSSTALGVYQYLIKTWEETESFKRKKISRTDYKANIREAMIDMSNGEIWRWEDCSKKIGLK